MQEPFSDYMGYVPQEEIDHFNSSPWTRQCLSHPSFKPISTPTRLHNPGANTQDKFFARTLNSQTTIPHWLVLKRKDWTTPAELSTDPLPEPSQGRGKGKVTAHPIPQADLILLADLGPDVNGYANTLHGGVLGAIFDEVLGLCVEGHRQNVYGNTHTDANPNPKPGTNQSADGNSNGNGKRTTTIPAPALFTGDLRVKYLSLVKSPGVVVVRAWLEWRRGRKWVLKGQVFGGQDGDGDGRVLAEAEGVWIASREVML